MFSTNRTFGIGLICLFQTEKYPQAGDIFLYPTWGRISELWVPRFSFQSTPPIRVATTSARSRIRTGKFQSTPPIRVATTVVAYCQANFPGISIHATHTGGDDCGCGTDSFGFLISIHATHTGGDLAFRPFRRLVIRISIHATHTGGDLIDRLHLRPVLISIHATHTGGDHP